MDLYADLPLAKGATSAAFDADGKLKSSSGSSVWTATAAPAFVPQVMRNSAANARPSPVVTTNSVRMLPAALRTKSPNAVTPPAAGRGISLAFKPAALTRKSPARAAAVASVTATQAFSRADVVGTAADLDAQQAHSGIGFGFAAASPAVRIQSTVSSSSVGQDLDRDDTETLQPVSVGPTADTSFFHATYRDEYDPLRPNSYEAYCEERVARKKLELVKRELDRRQREQERDGKIEREQLVRDIEAGTAQLSAAGRGRGMTVPAWMRKKIEDSAAAKSAAPRGVDTVAVNANAAADQFDDAMPRAGLGFAAARTTSVRVDGAVNQSVIDAQSRDASSGCVVLLQNMVGPDEVDDELQDEVKDECEEKYGPVAACIVYQVPATLRVAPEHAVRIFVQFRRSSDAEKARTGLNARLFGGRRVQAALFDDDRFQRRDLAA